MKTLNRAMMVVILLLFVVSLCSLAYAENWKLITEKYYEAMPDLEMNAETEKIYVDVDSIEKNGSIRKYWVQTVTYDHGLEETFITKVYNVFDCARNQGAIKINANGDVVPDHKLRWFPVCTGIEWLSHKDEIVCHYYPERKFVCEQ